MWRWWCEGGMDGLPRDVEPVQSTHLQSSCQPPSNQICCLPKTHHMFGRTQSEIWTNTIYNLDNWQFTIQSSSQLACNQIWFPKSGHMLPASLRSPLAHPLFCRLSEWIVKTAGPGVTRSAQLWLNVSPGVSQPWLWVVKIVDKSIRSFPVLTVFHFSIITDLLFIR